MEELSVKKGKMHDTEGDSWNILSHESNVFKVFFSILDGEVSGLSLIFKENESLLNTLLVITLPQK